jgi:hypothetical protein
MTSRTFRSVCSPFPYNSCARRCSGWWDLKGTICPIRDRRRSEAIDTAGGAVRIDLTDTPLFLTATADHGEQ